MVMALDECRIAETVTGQVYVHIQTHVAQVLAEFGPEGAHIWVLAHALEMREGEPFHAEVQGVQGGHLITSPVKWILDPDVDRLNDMNRSRIEAVQCWIRSWDTYTPQVAPAQRRRRKEAV